MNKNQFYMKIHKLARNFLIASAFIFVISYPLSAQKNYKNYTYFIYTIAKNVQWPANMTSGDFVIGVYGNSDITEHIKSMAASKRIGGRKIKVVEFDKHTDIKGCNMIFVPEEKSNDLHMFLGRVTSQSILVITDKPGLGRRGSGVNFITNSSGKLEFELNVAALKSAKLKISSDLVRFAQVL